MLQRMRTSSNIPNHLTYQLILDSIIKSSRGQGGSISKAEKILKNIGLGSGGTVCRLRPNTKLSNIVIQGKYTAMRKLPFALSSNQK